MIIPVTVIIATLNEESRLAACLGALRNFDEVIVVDSGSTDRTAEIAREHGATLIDFRWNGQYPKKRQWCLDNLETRHEWIFFVDADEIVTAAVVGELSALKFGCAGYFVKGRYIWNGKPLNHGLKNNKLALINRRKFVFPVVNDLGLPGMGEMEGHYQPVLRYIYNNDGIGQLNAELDHDAAHSEDQWLARHKRYAQWEAGMNLRKAWPKDPVKWRQALKALFRRMPFRGEIAFLHTYIWKLGVLDGAGGLDFARKRAAYYRMIRSCSRQSRNTSYPKAS
ncbi:MAG: glycosyl transferase family 2 [Micavibrio sp.]|nr:glycosyl transferase family 2 [Micavibrio sp.]